MKKKMFLSLTLCIMAFSVLFTGCESLDNQEDSIEEATDNNVEEREEIEVMGIETSYATLYYPEKWFENLRTEIIDEGTYMVKFYGRVAGKEEQHLFDIIFGESEGYTFGHLQVEEENIPVSVVSYNYELGEEWKEEETNIIYGMTEDVNYIIDKMEELTNFTINR